MKHCNMKVISAAIVAASMIAVPAFGQIRNGQDGHANDASNRVGSGGYNSPGTVYNTGLNQGNIWYNNVTGLSGFSGPVGSRDPGAFTGPIPALSDNFIRQSAGAPTSYQAPLTGNAPTAYYGSDRGVAPPIGTERLGYTQAYVGTSYTPSDTYSLDSQISSALDIQRQQLGTSTVLGVGTNALNNDNPASQIDQGGPLDATSSAGNFVGSPLYGLQGQGLGTTPSDTTDFGLPVFATPSSSSSGTGRFRSQNTMQVDQFQKELLDNGDLDQLQNAQNSSLNGNAQSPDSLSGASLARSIDNPNNKRLNSQVNSSITGSNIAGGINTQQGTQERLMSPERQSTQYNILAQRLAQLTNPQVALIQRNVNSASRVNVAMARGPEGGSAVGGSPATQPAIGAGPSQLNPDAFGAPPSANPNVQPLEIKSLADGIKAKGLHDLLSDAEKLMKDGKFESAIRKYDTAQRVAPNNGLIPLGRANAELGAGYYYQASADLHQVFQAAPALLLGQYDLRNWISDKRLEFITNELRDLSTANPKQETPAFLLAYLAYNTDQPAKAQTYIREAKARSNGRDLLLNQLESRWRLSASGASPDMNK